MEEKQNYFSDLRVKIDSETNILHTLNRWGLAHY